MSHLSMVLLAVDADDMGYYFLAAVMGVFICFVIRAHLAEKRGAEEKKAEGSEPGIPDAAPLSVEVRIIAKECSYVQNGTGTDISRSSRFHMICEDIEGGVRRQFDLDAAGFASLAEVDTGTLTYQSGVFFRFMPHPGSKPAEPAITVTPATERTCSYCAALVPLSELRCPGCGAKNRAETPRDLS